MSTTSSIDKLAGAGSVVQEDNLVNDPVTAIPTAAADPQIIRQAAVPTDDETVLRHDVAMVLKIHGEVTAGGRR
jgi:hypothetical protein